ncbi:methyl-accepting chemotaxis protein [Formivibrio citricus]|uniref:Methyl-accepting chemotaxis protein n=1 Tax=Formivibrio citricus TaxID=83765 RepID=A0A1I4W054_9NEIS|nr:methyl-accepting chemotaxis protein [Formivibrio citricus]SFN06840.1 methyl-accepting chemotaxis protein [Formivibrio citricus]
MALSIVRRLQIMAACSVVALLAVGITGARVTSKVNESLHNVNANTLPSVEAIADINENFMRLRILTLYHSLSAEPAKKVAVEKQMAAVRGSIDKGLARYEKERLVNSKDKELLEADKKLMVNYYTIIEKVLEKSRTEGVEAALAVINLPETQQGAAKMTEAMEAHKKYNRALADEQEKSASESARLGLIISWAMIAVGAAGVALLSIWLVRGIGRGLNSVQTAVGHIENNLDFTHRVEVHGNDELGVTAQAVNRLLEKMQGNLKTISGEVQTLAAAANQMASTADQVAKAAHQQSEAASSMAATVEEMTVNISLVGDRAQEANRISSESGQLAATGENVIGQTAHGINQIASTVHDAAARIHELEQHSQKISNVIAVIKEIADQTNLLALNAAIEAARAGEQGRGFAVVADEVRKLAERTASSTQEITNTIETMRTSASNAVQGMQGAVEEVRQGVARAQEANDSIRQIGEGSRSAVGMVEEITTAIREQGTATNNIATQVERIAQMSEESSAAAEESARAARDLDRMALGMHGIVAAYRL